MKKNKEKRQKSNRVQLWPVSAKKLVAGSF